MSAPQENIQANDVSKKKISLKHQVSVEHFGGPKRPLSAFLMYSNEVRDAVTAQIRAGLGPNDKFNISLVAKKIGENWKTVDEAQKASLVKKQEENKAKYDADMEAFKQTKEYRAYLKASALHSKKKADKKALVAAKASGMPQKPMAGYMLFGNFIRDTIKQELEAKGEKFSVQAAAKMTKEKWTALGEDGQKPYHEKFALAKEKYAAEVLAWNETDAGKEYHKQKETNAKRKAENQKVNKGSKRSKKNDGAAKDEEEDDEEEVELSPEEVVDFAEEESLELSPVE